MVIPPPINGRSTRDPEVYGLEELLLLAGQRLGEEVTSRTVRLYATQGLIDRPGRDGRSAVYGRRHLLQLLLIRSLAQRGLSLSAIAPLCVLPDAELEQQLASLDGPGPEGLDAAATSPYRQLHRFQSQSCSRLHPRSQCRQVQSITIGRLPSSAAAVGCTPVLGVSALPLPFQLSQQRQS